jgi:hypothetical protein
MKPGIEGLVTTREVISWFRNAARKNTPVPTADHVKRIVHLVNAQRQWLSRPRDRAKEAQYGLDQTKLRMCFAANFRNRV